MKEVQKKLKASENTMHKIAQLEEDICGAENNDSSVVTTTTVTTTSNVNSINALVKNYNKTFMHNFSRKYR